MADTDSKQAGETKLSPGADLTSAYASYFHVRVTPNITRIVFGDNVPGEPPRFHTALVVTTENALILADLIQKIAKENREKNASPAV